MDKVADVCSLVELQLLSHHPKPVTCATMVRIKLFCPRFKLFRFSVHRWFAMRQPLATFLSFANHVQHGQHSARARSRRKSGRFDSHNGSVFDLAFTPDGNTLVTAGADHHLHFSRADSSEVDPKEQRRRRQLLNNLDSKSFEVRQRAYHELAILGESATNDLNKSLRSPGSSESDLRTRSLLTLAATPRGIGHREEVRGIAISADGETVASASRDNMIGLWSVSSGRAISVIKGHSDGVWCVDFSRKGTRLASGGGDHIVRIWDTKTLAATHEFIGHESTIHDVRFSSDDSFVASAGGFDRTVRVWSIESKTCTHVFDQHADAVVCLDISPDDRTIISGDYDGSIYVWDLKRGELTNSFPAHRGVIREIAFVPGRSSHFVSVGDDGVAKLWDLAETSTSQVLTKTRSGICSIAFAPDEQSFVVGERDGQVSRVRIDAFPGD